MGTSGTVVLVFCYVQAVLHFLVEFVLVLLALVGEWGLTD